MGNWLPRAALLLLALHSLPALAERDPYSGAPLPPRKRVTPSPIEDHFAVRAAFYTARVSTDVRVDPYPTPPGVTGTALNGERDLGLPSRENQGRVEFMFRMRERHKVRLDYFEADRSGSQVLAQNVVFGSQTFAAGQRANLEIDWRMFDLTYTYSLLRNDRIELGTGIAVYFLQAEARGAVPAQNQYQDVSAADPVPALPVDFTWRISRRFALTARGAWLHATINGSTGTLTDAQADVQYRCNPNLGFGLGYALNTLAVRHVSSGFPGELHQRFRGPQAFVRVSF
ncbi:MAG: hypothetical protein JSR67_01775 [Proteobacteria bacterium]|nr:hypothetical protein [Pseudomonadota bacterium]